MIDYLAAEASSGLRHIWSAESNVQYERQLWVAVMEAQRAAGVNISDGALRTSKAMAHLVGDDLGAALRRIVARERVTRHDLKARLEIFCEDAGHEYHHLGLTSADIVENVYILRMRYSLNFLIDCWGNQQASSRYRVGDDLDRARSRLVWRGIKGAVGTQQDLVDLVGSSEAADRVDRMVAGQFGFDKDHIAQSTGQVMHRSQDHALACDLLAAFLRPPRDYKPNPWRSCLNGYRRMLAELAGSTWNEGDVSDSVVRRVAVPGMFFAFDVGMRYWYG